MTGRMENEPENEAAKRLAAEVQESQARNKAGRKPMDANRVVGGVILAGVCAGFAAFMFWPEQKATGIDIATAEPDQFQTSDSSPFGKLALPTRAPAEETGPDPDLTAQIEALKAEIERLKETPEAPEVTPEVTVEVTPPAPEDDQVAQLLERLDGLQAALDDSQKEAERARDDREREMATLRAQLDAARLGGGQEMPETSEAARLEEARQAYQQRVTSGMIAYGGSGGAGPAGGGGNPEAAEEDRKISGNEQFARARAVRAPVEKAKIIANPSNTVMQGTMIQAALETMIDTDLPGAIRAIVTENVYSYDGSQVLIPRGSRVVGAYNDQVAIGQRRAMIVWHRIIMPDNQTVDIGAYGGDGIGRAGVGGKVRTHALQRFGSAALVSLISLGPALALSNDDGDDGGGDMAGAVSQSLSAGVGSTLSGYLNRAPTIGVMQGSVVTIMVDRDLEIF